MFTRRNTRKGGENREGRHLDRVWTWVVWWSENKNIVSVSMAILELSDQDTSPTCLAAQYVDSR